MYLIPDYYTYYYTTTSILLLLELLLLSDSNTATATATTTVTDFITAVECGMWLSDSDTACTCKGDSLMPSGVPANRRGQWPMRLPLKSSKVSVLYLRYDIWLIVTHVDQTPQKRLNISSQDARLIIARVPRSKSYSSPGQSVTQVVSCISLNRRDEFADFHIDGCLDKESGSS